MSRTLPREDRVLGYRADVPPPAERLPRGKAVLLALFFVPPVAYVVVVLLLGWGK